MLSISVNFAVMSCIVFIVMFYFRSQICLCISVHLCFSCIHSSSSLCLFLKVFGGGGCCILSFEFSTFYKYIIPYTPFHFPFRVNIFIFSDSWFFHLYRFIIELLFILRLYCWILSFIFYSFIFSHSWFFYKYRLVIELLFILCLFSSVQSFIFSRFIFLHSWFLYLFYRLASFYSFVLLYIIICFLFFFMFLHSWPFSLHVSFHHSASVYTFILLHFITCFMSLHHAVRVFSRPGDRKDLPGASHPLFAPWQVER